MVYQILFLDGRVRETDIRGEAWFYSKLSVMFAVCNVYVEVRDGRTMPYHEYIAGDWA